MTITGADLALIRQEVDQYLPGRAAVRRLNETADGRGGATTAYSPHLADVPYRLEALTGTGPTDVGEKRSTVQTFRLKMPWGTDLVETDLVDASEGTLEPYHVHEAPYGGYLVAEVTLVT